MDKSLGNKKVHGYLISCGQQMVQSLYEDYVRKLFLRSTKLKYQLSQGWLFESYRLLTFTLREVAVFGVTWYAFSSIQSKCRKMQIRITPNTDTFYAVLTFLGENYLTNNATKFVEPIMESCHQDLKTLFICCKQFKNYDPFKLNLNCEIIRENLRAIFELSNNSSNCNKSQIFLLACKIYTKWHLCK